LIETISDNLPRFTIYERVKSDGILQTALLNVFTDVVGFSVLAVQYFARGTLGQSSALVNGLMITADHGGLASEID